ncbi:alpha-L-fucosidase [Chitinophaga skermanii]|uniref:alpha-L-fucosidase n=1 Tax=Chitinophaga skermanii TaxID=331697 RepID=A0A327QUF8_9BACT|nr:alpha-L-fucosidase [Chitinophaga skermanii]RAJ08239.1 alpha-L-fucosidase [Chitinophaga skermanii]
MKFTRIVSALCLLPLLFAGRVQAQQNGQLHALQQKFVDLRFGMFIHFNIPTFMEDDWADPDASPALFNPRKLDCKQWADAAAAANMTYGCLTTKHHSGFAIWDTKTTDYSVMSSPFKRDVVKEYVEAFRAKGLRVMLYYSILDTHHKIRPGHITPAHIAMIKAQITELLTKYGEIDALIIDGWDAPWSRISYEDVPFGEIYGLIKQLQPKCLVMDLNAAKYPAEALFYTDIKSYEQGAGQHISTSTNRLPALACLPLQQNWFYKSNFATTPVKEAGKLVNEIIVPYNKAWCNFILNVAPNRDGLFDANAIDALKAIGKQWKNEGPVAPLPANEAPIIAENIAKHVAANSSWSDDMNIMDFANDDNFRSSWSSHPSVKQPWYEVEFPKERSFNMITMVENSARIKTYHFEYFDNGVWKPLPGKPTDAGRVKIFRFPRVWGTKVKIVIESFSETPSIAEFAVYDEKRN